MWADKSNPKLRRCQQRIAPFFFFYLSLFLSVFCSSTSTFFPCRHLFFFPVTIARSRMHTYTRRLLTLGGVRASTPQGPAAPLPTSFCSRWGFFSSYFFHRSRSEEIRTSGSESREFYAHGFRICNCGVTVGGI